METVKKCTECEKEFIPTSKTGSEQKYCCGQCRSKASVKRSNERIINDFRNNNNNEKESQSANNSTNNIGTANLLDNNSTNRNFSQETRNNNEVQFQRKDLDNNSYKLLERNFEERIVSLHAQLKYEAAIKENEELKRTIVQLELELMEYDEEETEEENGMIGQIMTSFKTDPINTISFASELINNLLKPKVNATET